MAERKSAPKNALGLVHVITGDGKGKTTAAFGLALRAVGRGLSVCIVQFMKGFEYGEVLAAQRIENLEIKQFGRAEFVNKEKPEQIDIDYAKDALQYGKEVINSGKYDVVILDEINVALDFKLVAIDDVVTLVKEKPKILELVLTGRNAPEPLIELGDYVSEIKDIKHPYQKGVKGRKGIEF
jgi:cob(I)alamin adenosyltransferase